MKLSTAILETPNHRFTIVGSVPVALCHERKTATGLTIFASNSYPTELDAINALLAIGITHFQLANCKWYDYVIQDTDILVTP